MMLALTLQCMTGLPLLDNAWHLPMNWLRTEANGFYIDKTKKTIRNSTKTIPHFKTEQKRPSSHTCHFLEKFVCRSSESSSKSIPFEMDYGVEMKMTSCLEDFLTQV